MDISTLSPEDCAKLLDLLNGRLKPVVTETQPEESTSEPKPKRNADSKAKKLIDEGLAVAVFDKHLTGAKHSELMTEYGLSKYMVTLLIREERVRRSLLKSSQQVQPVA